MQVITNKSSLTIELQGREQIWALRTTITIPKKYIIRVEYRKYFDDWRKWEVRLPGTGMPGKLIAGSFWTEQGWDFLYLTNPKGWLNPAAHGVLYIETTQQKFKRIILSCSKEQAILVENWAA